MLGREDELRNELPVGTQVARERRAFDQAGEPLTALKDVQGQRRPTSFTTRTAPDSLGQVGSQEYPTGEVVVTTLDAAGVQSRLIVLWPSNSATVPLTHAYLTNATANITGRRRPSVLVTRSPASSGTTTDPSPGAASGQTSSISQKITSSGGGFGDLSTREYQWDAVGNLRKTTEAAQGRFIASYTYDDIDRIRFAMFEIGATTQAPRSTTTTNSETSSRATAPHRSTDERTAQRDAARAQRRCPMPSPSTQ